MKIKKWLIALAAMSGLFIMENLNANAARLPNRLTGTWIHRKANLKLYRYSGRYNNGNIHIHLTHFRSNRNGWYTYHCYTYPMPFKLIHKNEIKMQDGAGYNYIYLHRLTKAQIRRAKLAHQRAIKHAKQEKRIHNTKSAIKSAQKDINGLQNKISYDKKDIPISIDQYNAQKNDPEMNDPTSEMYTPNSANEWLQRSNDDKQDLNKIQKRIFNDKNKIQSLSKTL